MADNKIACANYDLIPGLLYFFRQEFYDKFHSKKEEYGDIMANKNAIDRMKRPYMYLFDERGIPVFVPMSKDETGTYKKEANDRNDAKTLRDSGAIVKHTILGEEKVLITRQIVPVRREYVT